MTSEQLIDQGRVWLVGHYPDYWNKPGLERRVLSVAWLCDVVRPREATGHNDGEVVECLLKSAGVGKGNPWCAAAQSFCADVAKVWRPKSGSAAVLSWRLQGSPLSLTDVKRGDMLIRDHGLGKRHIGCALKVYNVLGIRWVKSIEGNTSAGDEGSQRDGQGMYRRTRLLRFWTHAVKGG